MDMNNKTDLKILNNMDYDIAFNCKQNIAQYLFTESSFETNSFIKIYDDLAECKSIAEINEVKLKNSLILKKFRKNFWDHMKKYESDFTHDKDYDDI